MNEHECGLEFCQVCKISDMQKDIDAITQTIAELTAKLDAVRGLVKDWQGDVNFSTRMDAYECGRANRLTKSAGELLAILDAPTKEARNGEE